MTLSTILTQTDFTYNGNSTAGATLIINGFPSLSEAINFSMNDLDYLSDSDNISIRTQTSTSKTFDILSKNTGTYSFNLNGSSNSNYMIDSKSTSFTIIPLTLSISWPTNTYTYDGNTKSFTPSVTNKIGNDIINISYTFEGSSYLGNSITSTSMKDAGEYILRINEIDNPNYSISGLSTDANDGILAKNVCDK